MCCTTSFVLSEASGAGPTAISTFHLVQTAGSGASGVPNAICPVKPQTFFPRATVPQGEPGLMWGQLEEMTFPLHVLTPHKIMGQVLLATSVASVQGPLDLITGRPLMEANTALAAAPS